MLFLLLVIIIIDIIIDRSTVAGLLLQLVGHVLCTSGLQVAWKTFWNAFSDSFFWTSVGPSCVALPRPREDGEEDCREDAADIGRNWVQTASPGVPWRFPGRRLERSRGLRSRGWAKSPTSSTVLRF